MSLSEITSQLPFVVASGYALILGILYWRGHHLKRTGRYLIYFLALSILWTLLLGLMVSSQLIINLPSKLLLLGSLLLGLTTTAYVNWPQQRWLLLGGLTLLALTILDLIAPLALLPPPVANWLTLRLTVGGLAAMLVWLILASYITSRAWQSYRQTRLPWHANRLLFWVVALVLVFAGELLLFVNTTYAILAGHLLRLLGVIGLAHAVSSYRIFDVRAHFRRALALLLYAILSAVPAAAGLLLLQQLTEPLNALTTNILFLVAIALGFLIYRPFPGLLDRLIQRLFLGEGFETSVVVRNYTQAISQTLDMEQLSLVVIGTISEMLAINRGALLLVTAIDGGFEVEPVPAMGQIPRQTIRFAADSLLIGTLRQQHQPLLQYELDFNPVYRAVDEHERAWLSQMAMELYVPVSSASSLAGIIALGPKSSGLPYRPGELDLVQLLADQTVIALHNARLYSELDTQNETVRLLNADLRQQNERLAIIDQVKTDFITIASHELRTPLTQVKGYADILAAMNEDSALTREQTREIVGHINRASLQLERLISAMLDASQLDVEGINLNFMETKLETVIRLAIEPINQAIRERRLQLRLVDVANMPPIYADFKRLVQAFSNLLGNAVKYTPNGGSVTIQSRLVPSDDKATEYLEIVIADTGIGIDPKFHELIFEKFFRIGDPQLHSTGSTKFKGAGPGLGLPIARGVIEAHAGRIWVESEGEDEERLPGSQFHIMLPVNPPALMAKMQLMKRLQPSGKPDGEPADDSPNGRLSRPAVGNRRGRAEPAA